MIKLPLMRGAALLAAFYCLQAGYAAGPTLEIGIDRSRLTTQSEEVRARTLTGIHDLGATWFRDTYVPHTHNGLQDFVDEVRLAKQQNLKFLDGILPVGADFNYTTPNENAGEAFDKRCGWHQGSAKLSRINLDKFADRMRAQLGALKAAGLTVDAFEIGNEFDWICFNGDVPDGHAASPEEFMTAVRAYAHFLKAAAEVIRDPQFYPDAKIITFGIAHASDRWDRPPHHFDNPARMIAQLRNVDGYNYLDNASYHVDGYGEHIYPSTDSVGQNTRDTLERDIAVLGRDRPYWITEWGLSIQRFPNKSGQTRAEGIAEFYATLEGFHGVDFGPVFYYAYDWAGGKGLTDPDGNPAPDARAVVRER